MTSILAIDQGTSGTKALVVDERGRLLALAEEPVNPVYLQGGGVEQDPGELLDSVLVAGRRAVAAAGRPVEMVTIANQGETVLAWDPVTGAPLSPAVVWQDRRSADLCAELTGHAAEVAARTGLVLDPYFSAPKMAWLRRNVTTAGVVTTTDSWLVHRLTGELVSDVTTASRSLLLDVDAVSWDPWLVELFGLTGETLPRLVDCDEVVGTTAAFGGQTAVAGLVVDQQAALFAEGCHQQGDAKCTYGTGAFLLVNTGGQAVRSTAGLTTSVAWRLRGAGSYCLDGQVFTAGSVVRWLGEIGLVADAGQLDATAAPESAGTLFVPALAGLGAPWWRPDATSAFLGMTLSTRREHLLRAVVEGIAAQVAELARTVAVDLGRPLARLRVDGGLTRSTALMQAQADLMQVPVDVYPSEHATAMGTAALGRLAADPGLDPADALAPWDPVRSYEPRWSPAQAEEFLARWRAGVAATLPAPRPAGVR
ncbi:MAG: FGGY family carbohydrate kinase [Nocardioidaceae bacterium]